MTAGEMPKQAPEGAAPASDVQPKAQLTGPFTGQQAIALNAPLNTGARMLMRDNMSYLAAWDVRRYLIKILGYGGFSDEVLDSTLLYEVSVPKPQTADQKEKGIPAKPGWTVGYRARVQLTVYVWVEGMDGNPYRIEVARYSQEATGAAQNFPDPKRADAHDFAVKTAVSQALKRCAIDLGDQFGLGLYAKQAMAQSVGGVIVGMPAIAGQPKTAADLKLDEEKPVTEDGDLDESENVPEAELDWLSQADEVKGQEDAFMTLYNKARAAKVSRGTLLAMRNRAGFGEA